MEYETITHWRGYETFYEHRMNGIRVVLKNPVEAHRLVPLCEALPWTPQQVNRLIELNLLTYIKEPFQIPPSAPKVYAVDNSLDKNFVHIDWMNHPEGFLRDTDILFDGNPPGGYRFFTFDDTATMAHIVYRAGAFKSVADARRNGWNKPVPPGFSLHTIGKKRPIAILNKYDGMFD